MYVLDTNTLSEFFKGNPTITARAASVMDHIVLHTTIITRHEILDGRFASILKAANSEELERANNRYQYDESKLLRFPTLQIDAGTTKVFVGLLMFPKLKKMGRKDLLITATKLSRDAVLVTRNVKDFSLVPNLKIENWFDLR
jgi:tRNA(fMet)-specific endonuclease VapC